MRFWSCLQKAFLLQKEEWCEEINKNTFLKYYSLKFFCTIIIRKLQYIKNQVFPLSPINNAFPLLSLLFLYFSFT